MRAAQILPGPAGGTLRIVDAPEPEPGSEQVLIRVHAAGLNRGELNQVANARGQTPLPIGVEFAGEVVVVGPDVDRWRVGDRVMGHGNGGQAEYVLAAQRALMPVPAQLDWVQAATFPNVFITAHDALVTNGELRPGETVLVDAASSGIGLAAIRIAQALGAGSVIATSRSAAKLVRLRELGVDHTIDISREDQVAAVRAFAPHGADIVIDSVGAALFEANVKSLAVKGRLVNVGRLGGSVATLDLTDLWLNRLRLIGVTFRTRTEEERLACVEACARDLLGLLAAGKLTMPVDRTFALEDLAAAHDYIQQDRHFGKIVIIPDSSLAATRADLYTPDAAPEQEVPDAGSLAR